MVLNMKASDFDTTDSIHQVAASNFACLVLNHIRENRFHQWRRRFDGDLGEDNLPDR